MSSSKRILFYSHDTFGLGHIRRTQKLANKIAGDDRSILVACASPKASSFASSPGIEYLNLPGFTKQLSGEYVPRSLNVPIEDFVQLRASLLLSTVRAFNPDIFVIDKEPLGVKRELLPALQYLRDYQKKCRIACGFRDILDDKETVLKEWKKRDTVRALEYYFDDILIYGGRDIFDFSKEYEVPDSLAAKMRYTGYIHSEKNLEVEPFSFSRRLADRPLVTLTLGGGGDGSDILELCLQTFGESDPGFQLVLLTGPFVNPGLFARAKQLEKDKPYITCMDFIPNTSSLFEQSDLVVSMGGYNTMTELLALQKYPLILPRVKPRREQLIRAQMFERMGYCQYIAPENLSASSLLTKIKSMLRESHSAAAFPSDGLNQFKSWANSIL